MNLGWRLPTGAFGSGRTKAEWQEDEKGTSEISKPNKAFGGGTPMAEAETPEIARPADDVYCWLEQDGVKE